MKTYDTYQEAKIANPDSEIVTTGKDWDGRSDLIGKFQAFVCEGLGSHKLGDTSWVKCNPAYHCMTVESFLADGYKFVEGDIYLNSNGRTVGSVSAPHFNNQPSTIDFDRYILRAAALENQMNIDNLATQTPEEKEVLDSVRSSLSGFADIENNCVMFHSDISTTSFYDLAKSFVNSWDESMAQDALDLIDTTPHQYEMSKFSGNEWNGEGLPPVGVECEVRFRTDGDWTDWFSNGKFKAGYDSKIWFSHEFGDCVYPSHDVEFRKPETQQQREERERLEAAYDLYCHVHNENNRPHCDFDSFKLYERSNPLYTVVVDKTNYRKESN